MSSTSPIITDDIIQVIKAARLANAEALARLTAAFESGLENRAEWFWKSPLKDPRKPNHFLTRESLNYYCDLESAPFWAKILCGSLALFSEKCFADIPVVWAAFALDEISAHAQAPGARNLGLKQSIIIHSNREDPLQDFKYSISKPFIDARLAELLLAKPSTIVEQKGIGLCVTKDHVSRRFGQLHFIHVNNAGEEFAVDDEHGEKAVELLGPLISDIRDDEPDGHLWDAYLNGFGHLVPNGNSIRCHLSATSLFHSLTKEQAHAAAHLVFGFGTPPSREQALLIYHCLQIVHAGLPALYSSMCRLMQEAAGLAKYKQMVQLLEPPLKRISSVFGQMQSDTQELRAVLYDPEEALFASYSLVEPFFRNGTSVRFQKAALPPIRLEHSPELYSDNDIQLITAVALCAVFGKDKELLDQEDLCMILSKASSIMRQVSSEESSARMANDLGWLVGNNELHMLFGMSKSSLRVAIRDSCINALTNIKAALFTPFKPDSTKWPEAAIQLLRRDGNLKNSKLKINGHMRSLRCKPVINSLMENPERAFPCSYSTMLTFIRDFAGAAKSSQYPATVNNLDFNTKSANIFTISLSQDPNIDVLFLREKCQTIMAVSRDWRVENANYGDMTRAFILFANRLLGIGSEWKVAETGTYSRQEIIRASRNEEMFVVSWSAERRQLTIKSQTL